ncbi:hypothetical protein A2344_01160 [Candidatus Peregrinibacteria bacterium RIFOXYB12_FULL_41_12]|nr:MAG: hypothetical protein A2344_01160 [Candidatus Peregrinibacteria bacterium RIFOXYB12_FULL_41_12]OGJ48349.1 MAG: hypothetical protein A2244_02220 [Candidatus Peregrinibacteria bacterium RIFOXYA2_FULL_41_18]OGJ53467.1 MAG: hypothetical protein A2448_02880 [Candidatus Peregrinibacteria bacterium RIFOXYC2_FULL_41_22]OGJ54314.1 MAG: hypothetical protein A2336_00755 [Candidatus Peregrinibacteria bacterium RIFOXYB2_FULL_41_88]
MIQIVFFGCGEKAETVIPTASIDAPTSDNTGAQSYSVNISGYAFDPAELTIVAGDSVTWTNLDSVAHSIVADSFSSDNFSTNESFTYTFDATGVYEYFCGPHPNMTGIITVTK